MEYLTYILIIVGIMVLCVLLLREREPVQVRELNSHYSLKTPANPPVKQTAEKHNSNPLPLAEAALQRKRQTVPVPWGWPGHDEHSNGKNPTVLHAEEVHGVSESLHRFVDRMMLEKQTVHDQGYLLKKDASLKALIEDRYGRVRAMPGFKPEIAEQPDAPEADKKIRFEPLRELKTPWGW